jgi:Putative mono-oxygenase ydhR
MQTIIITFTLTDMSDERYREVCAELAPAFAELRGLHAKIWLADPATATYGGVYLFADAADVEAFLGSALFRTVRMFPHFTDIQMRRFEVDEATTLRTQPGVRVVGPARAAV